MILFKSYSNIKGFLKRYTILKVGKLHIRLHRITDKDQSTLFHNHPFHYLSIILKGGYEETYIKDDELYDIKHRFLSIILRKNTIFHRITEVKNETLTLFITYGNYGWKAFNTKNDISNDGVFERIVNGKMIWSKKENGIWFIGNTNKLIAKNELRHSIHQVEQ